MFFLLSAWSKAAHAVNQEGTFWMPPQASSFAAEVDFVYYFIYWIDIVFFVGLMGTMIWFAIRYRQREEGEPTSPIKGSHTVELIWAVGPSFFLIAMFVLGFKSYLTQSIPPADAMEVRVTGQKWNWSFSYPDLGIEGESTLIVPVDTPVRLTMNSRDVLHSFYVPDFRIKKDVLPNRYTVIWFDVPEIFDPRPHEGRNTDGDGIANGLGVGEHQVYCTEYCGDGHSRMLTTVQVLTDEDWEKWVDEKTNIDLSAMTAAERGGMYYKSKGCAGCHSVDGSRLVGPSLLGLWGKEESLADGTSVMVEDNYLRESIMDPGAKIVATYDNQMTPYAGILSDDEVNDLIDFIKTLEN